MTIIAYKSGEMAADSGMWNGGRVTIVPFPKITTAHDGSLWALTGKANDSWLLRTWILSGMPKDKLPDFIGKGDDEPHIIQAKTDGTLWSSRGNLRFCPTAEQGCWGEGDAAHFCEGAMEAGLSAGEAVSLTIKHHCYAHGEVQIERLLLRLAAVAD
jgi:hypothetical protein